MSSEGGVNVAATAIDRASTFEQSGGGELNVPAFGQARSAPGGRDVSRDQIAVLRFVKVGCCQVSQFSCKKSIMFFCSFFPAAQVVVVTGVTE